MKKSSTIYLTMLLLMVNLVATSQKLDDQYELAKKIDQNSFATGFFLNSGLSSKFISELKELKNQVVTGSVWTKTYKGLVRSDMRQAKLRDLSFLKITPKVKRPENTTIPIGVISLDGNNLSPEEVVENINLKEKGQKVDGSKYEVTKVMLSSL